MASQSRQASLLLLPIDILSCLPFYLHDIEDFMNLSSTCRSCRSCLVSTPPQTILRLAAAASRIFFRPSPYFLVAATARQLGDWARLHPENEEVLSTALEQGIDGVLELCIAHCSITMERIRELHEMRFSTINPTIDLIDKCVGEQWYATPNFWNGGVDDALTLDTSPSENFFHLVTYGEFFGPDFDIFLSPQCGRRSLSVETRLQFVKYCIPDIACFRFQQYAPPSPLRIVKATGPYAGQTLANRRWSLPHSDYQRGLLHLLRSKRWKRPWSKAREGTGGVHICGYTSAYGRDWRQLFWETIVTCQGFSAFEGLKEIQSDQWRERLSEWRLKIKALKQEPERINFSEVFTYRYPFLTGDLSITTTGL